MTVPAAVEAWAIKAPEWSTLKSSLMNYNVRAKRIQAIRSFCESEKNWRYWYRRGYRCVRVTVQEMQE